MRLQHKRNVTVVQICQYGQQMWQLRCRSRKTAALGKASRHLRAVFLALIATLGWLLLAIAPAHDRHVQRWHGSGGLDQLHRRQHQAKRNQRTENAPRNCIWDLSLHTDKLERLVT
jgi:hypothetical protein